MAYLYLLETSLMVENMDEAIETYGCNFGIWPQANMSFSDIPEHGNIVHFCTVGDLALAPTRFTIVQPTEIKNPDHWIGLKWKEQAPCPYRIHCFCLVVDDLDLLLRHYDRLSIPYNITTLNLNVQEVLSQQVTGRRVFPGRPKGDPSKYDPSFDANAMMEVLSVKETPIWSLPATPAPPVASLRPGAFVRIESWSLLVEDIYKTTKLFGRNFLLWPAPSSIVRDIPEEGVKSILIPIGGMPESAKLELISPYDFNKPIGKWFKQYGNRFYHIRFLVNDLDARLRELESKKVAFDVRQPGETLKYKRAWIDPACAMGANLEFVDYSAYVGNHGSRLCQQFPWGEPPALGGTHGFHI